MASLTNSNLSLRLEKSHQEPSKVEDAYTPVPCRNYLTFCVFASFMALGMAGTIVGPTFVHLSYMFETDIETLAIAFTTGAIGYMLGSLVCGLIADRFNTELQFCASTISIGLMTSLMPWARSVYMYYVIDFLRALGMGYVDACGQSYIIYLWTGHKLKEPMMQAMHGIWSVGATIGPFLLVPLIPELPPEADTPTTELYSDNATWAAENVTQDGETPAIDDEFKSDIRFCYALIGSGVLIMSVAFIAGFCALGPTCIKTRGVTKKKPTKSDSTQTGAEQKNERSFVVTILCLQFVLYFAFAWLEIIPGGYLATLAIKGLHWEAKRASLLMAVFWAAHGTGRIVAVPVSYVVRPGVMSGVCILGTTVGFIIMLFSVSVSETLLWVGCATAAFFLSSIFASMILWTSDYITITAFVGAVFLLGSSTGCMIGGPLVGYLFQRHSPMWIVYLSLIACGIEITVFTVLQVYVRMFPRQKRNIAQEHNEDELQAMKRNEHA